MEKQPLWFYNQSGVIPFVRGEELKIVLVTSRRSRRWVIPKGVVEQILSPAQSAVKEAFEEAGIEGRIYEKSIGEYSYRKWGGTCHVTVFLFEVLSIHDAWPEATMRIRQLFTISEASRLLQEDGLKKMILQVPTLVAL